MVGMAAGINNSGKYKVVALIPEKGDIEKKFKENSIPYYIVPQHELWTTQLGYEMHQKAWKKIARTILCAYERKRIKCILKKEHVDLVHINTVTGGMAGEVAEKLNIPVVWHIREFLEDDIGAKFVNPAKMHTLLDGASRIIAITEAVKEKWSSFTGTKICVIYNGVAVNDSQPRKICNDDYFKIGIFGRVCKGKRQLDIVKAVEKLNNDSRNKVKVAIWGNIEDDKYYHQVVEEISQNNLKGIVEYKGYSPNATSEMRKIDCLCVCSAREAFGRTTVEGMQSGCIVIGSDSGGTPELIENKVDGLLYSAENVDELAKTIQYCIDNPSEVNRIAKTGQDRALTKFSEKNNYLGVLRVYDEILNGAE